MTQRGFSYPFIVLLCTLVIALLGTFAFLNRKTGRQPEVLATPTPVVLPSTLPMVSPPATASALLPYTSATASYSLSYPKTWQLSASTLKGGGEAVVFTQKAQGVSLYPKFIIETMPLQSSVLVDVDKRLQGLLKLGYKQSDVSLYDKKVTKLTNTMPGVAIRDNQSLTIQIQSTLLLFTHKNQHFTLIYEYEGTAPDTQYESEFMTMVNSVTLHN